MTRNMILSTLAGVALLSAGPAFARGGAAGGSLGLGANAGAGTGATGGIGATVRDQARINSQGAANASATGIARRQPAFGHFDKHFDQRHRAHDDQASAPIIAEPIARGFAGSNRQGRLPAS